MQKTRNRRTPLSLGDSARWSAYAAAGVAGAIGTTQAAEAAITYVDVDPDVTLDTVAAGSAQVFSSALTGGASLYFYNLPLVNTSAGPVVAGRALGSVFGASVSQGVVGFVAGAGSFNYAANLSYGQDIGAAAASIGNVAFGTMIFASGFTYSQFGTTGEAFVGFQFDVGAGTQFGWARVNMDSGVPENTFTVMDFAFADAGESIFAGQVPEPGSLGLLALGALGLTSWRKRRGEAA